MSQVVQARCPQCKNVLRIPAEWVYQPMRCKHCGQIFQAQVPPRPAAPAPAPPAPAPAPAPAQAIAPARPTPIPNKKAPLPAASPRKAKARKAAPVAAGVAPPRRPSAPAGGGTPLVINGPGAAAAFARPPRRPGSWKPIALGVGVLALVAIVAVVLGPQIADLFQASPPAKERPVVKKGDEQKVASTDGRETPKADADKDSAKKTDADKEPSGAGDKKAPPPKMMEEMPEPAPKKDETAKKDETVKRDETPKKADGAPKKDKSDDEPPPLVRPKDKDAPKKGDDGKPKTDNAKPGPEKVAMREAPKVVPRPPPQGPPAGKDHLPRRALFISVNDYLYANPLHFGTMPFNQPNKKPFPGSSTQAVKTLFGNLPLRFPNTQLFQLSDAGVQPHAPLKPVIERTVAEFLSTSRPQDRIILMFAGQALEDEKEAYLVPLEGDLSDTKTLIPLSWVYEQLSACKARQKVLILDVCRFDPTRGQERPGGEPMGKVLDGLLQNPPAGVQVWSSCVAGQQSIEFENGSVFLQSLCAVLQELLETKDKDSPGNSIPVDRLQELTNAQMTLSLIRHKMRQTSRLTGKEVEGGSPFNPDEPAPELVTIEPPALEGGVASANEVKGILDEIAKLPPVRARKGANDTPLDPNKLPAFSAKVLDEFKADYPPAEFEKQGAKSPFRAAVIKAIEALRESSTKFAMRENFTGANTGQVKAQIKNEQSAPGKAKFYLKEAYDDLKAVAAMRDEEKSKRWQATYDYVLSRLISRLLFVVEYNYVLAQIRTDSLPELPEGSTTYKLQLGSRAKIGVPESYAKDWVKERKKLLDRIVNQYPDTPWAVIARRERLTALGLEWRPARN